MEKEIKKRLEFVFGGNIPKNAKIFFAGQTIPAEVFFESPVIIVAGDFYFFNGKRKKLPTIREINFLEKNISKLEKKVVPRKKNSRKIEAAFLKTDLLLKYFEKFEIKYETVGDLVIAKIPENLLPNFEQFHTVSKVKEKNKKESKNFKVKESHIIKGEDEKIKFVLTKMGVKFHKIGEAFFAEVDPMEFYKEAKTIHAKYEICKL
ncbi:MAG: hypothetical protein KatS3mg104_2932 [Phycisphaerae bacterium]|nr:MAG: hypothetical protein KatS3mg104_2932 [Phycisphaerae bacterium]